jgi:hypothetical protein
VSACYSGQLFPQQVNGFNPRHFEDFVCPAIAPDKRNAFLSQFSGQLLVFSMRQETAKAKAHRGC